MDVQLNELAVFLQEKGLVVNKIDESNNLIEVSVKILMEEYSLKCELPSGFPYVFPRIFIVGDSSKQLEMLPHISYDKSICTFDSNVVIPNYNEPCQLVYECLQKSISIIEDGKRKINKHDFIEEISSYWSMGTSEVIIKAYFAPGKTPKKYQYYRRKNIIYVSSEPEKTIEYLEFNGIVGVKKKNFKVCLFLPLQMSWYPPYPATNDEIYSKLREDESCFRAYKDFQRNNSKETLVIFSQKVGDGYFMGGWIQEPMIVPKGFGVEQYNVLLLKTVGNHTKTIKRCNVQQLNRERIYSRGGDGKNISTKQVTITGCGSVGSALMQILREIGIYKYTLIDNDILSSENISRHVCGENSMGTEKVYGLKKEMILHYPGLECETYSQSVFDVFQSNMNVFNIADFNFVVVGNIPAEVAFLRNFESGRIRKPLIIIWVEPYLLGGHTLVIQENTNIDIIIDQYLDNPTNILEYSPNYVKREAGCQSTYLPYSAFEMKKFIYAITDFLYQNFMKNNKKGNYILSWCGDLSWARKNNLKITDSWLAENNNTLRCQKV